MKTVVVIPARYASTRFPGKPLAKIAGKEMVVRVHEIAQKGAEGYDCEIIVATEDDRIMSFCKDKGINCVMTSDKCRTGTDRVSETVQQLNYKPDFILNLQGDAPLTPPWFIAKMIDEFSKDPKNIDIITPGFPMSWEELDRLRENKKTTPFSGTSIVLDRKTNNAVWFSKNIIPAIRKEEKHRESMEKSPVIRHIGLYGYSYEMLMSLGKMDEGYYEVFEGLEQLRALENGYTIRVAIVDYRGRTSMSGVDAPVDVERAEKLLAKDGELV